MMRYYIVMLIFFPGPILLGEEEHYTSNPEWRQRMLAMVEVLAEQRDEAAIARLGESVRKLARPAHRERPDRPVFEAAQAALLSIPGHAEYFRDEINEARIRYEKALESGGVESGSALVNLNNLQIYNSETLSHLPSPETVRVLGEFLYDERGKERGRDEYGEFTGEAPNSSYAVRALHALPIVNKPLNARNARYEHLNTYRLWYEQIKSGNRTFRFEGDPTEYDLHGPAPKEKLARIARNQARDSQRAKGRSDIASTESKTSADSSGKSGVSVTIGILAALLLLGSAMWYWKKSAGRAP